MGDYAYLVTTDSESFSDYYDKKIADNNMYLLRKYALPPFWLALFLADDLVTEKVTDADGDTFETSFFITSKSAGLTNFNKHKAVLLKRFGNSVLVLIEQFAQFVRQHEGKNLLLDTLELQVMDDIEIAFWSKELLVSHQAVTQRHDDVPPVEIFKSKAGHQLGFLGLLNLLGNHLPPLDEEIEYVGASVGIPAPWETLKKPEAVEQNTPAMLGHVLNLNDKC